MARRKTLPDSLRAKLALASRLASLRLELFGERGGPEMARRLGIPVRTWYNYEGGVTVPAEVVLKIIELTQVEPSWLLHGKGPKYRAARPEVREAAPKANPTVGALLRTALQLLEGQVPQGGAAEGDGPAAEGPPFEMPLASPARNEWLEAKQENRCIQVAGHAMAPIVADGAYIAFSGQDEDPAQLDGKMVVVWFDDQPQPQVRWFRLCGRYALLRAENQATAPQQQLVDLEAPAGRPRWRRVLWIDTPH